jgi:hypothetical protein
MFLVGLSMRALPRAIPLCKGDNMVKFMVELFQTLRGFLAAFFGAMALTTLMVGMMTAWALNDPAPGVLALKLSLVMGIIAALISTDR